MKARQHRQHRAIHGHGDAHAVERNAVEQDFHVLDGIDRHAGLADIAFDPRMIAVIAAMGGKIESHRQAHLPRLQILAVERVGFLGGREAGILADGPGPAGIHAGAGPAGEGRLARPAAGFDPLQIGLGIERLDGDAFRGLPDQRLPVPAS